MKDDYNHQNEFGPDYGFERGPFDKPWWNSWWFLGIVVVVCPLIGYGIGSLFFGQ